MIARRLFHVCVPVICVFSALTVSAQAQEDEESTSKFFVKVIGGYSFVGPASFTGTNRTERTAGPSTILNEFETNKKKFGIGPRFGVGLGIIVNPRINLGIDAVYIKGMPLHLTNYINSQRDTSGLTVKTTNTHIDSRYEYSVLDLVPHITFKAISTPNYYIYNRVGLIIGLPLKLNYAYSGTSSVRTQIRSNAGAVINDSTVNNTYDYFGNFSKTPTLGYQAALGIQVRISPNLRLFAEVEASSMVIIPKEFLYEKWLNTTTTITSPPTPAKTVTTTDSALRHMYFLKKGQERTVVNASTNTIDVYTTRTRMATNSIAVNIGLALRL